MAVLLLNKVSIVRSPLPGNELLPSLFLFTMFYHIWNEFFFRREVQTRLPTPMFNKFSTISVMVIYGNKVNSQCLQSCRWFSMKFASSENMRDTSISIRRNIRRMNPLSCLMLFSLAHKHKHEYKKNKHVLLSYAYACAYANAQVRTA